MTSDSPAPAEGIDPSAQALAAAMPEIRSAKTIGWISIAAAIAVTVVALYWLADIPKAMQFIILVLVISGVIIWSIADWTRRRHERVVMPIIADAFGLSYQKSPGQFFTSLPRNFIPLGGRRSVDDMMSGRVADRYFSFAECKTETGGKNSSTLFQGVVIQVQGRQGVPPFIIASERETKGFLFFKGRVDVEGMNLVRQATGTDGQTYGLWVNFGSDAQLTGLQDFMDRIIALGPRVLGSASLYSLVSSGSNYHVSLRHNRDMFRIGGLLAQEAEVMTHIRIAAAEFAHPVQLVTEILRAEEALTKT